MGLLELRSSRILEGSVPFFFLDLALEAAFMVRVVVTTRGALLQ
jgi:hypothetical protein